MQTISHREVHRSASTVVLNPIKLAIRTDQSFPERYPGSLRSLLLSQVSRFLVVQPQDRCSAEEALAHPFFQEYVVEEVRHFSPRGKFKVLKSNLPQALGGKLLLPPEALYTCPHQAPRALNYGTSSCTHCSNSFSGCRECRLTDPVSLNPCRCL